MRCGTNRSGVDSEHTHLVVQHLLAAVSSGGVDLRGCVGAQRVSAQVHVFVRSFIHPFIHALHWEVAEKVSRVPLSVRLPCVRGKRVAYGRRDGVKFAPLPSSGPSLFTRPFFLFQRALSMFCSVLGPLQLSVRVPAVPKFTDSNPLGMNLA